MSRRSDAWGDVTVDELLIGGSKALANAQDLLSDARLLLENSRIARAYALAQLAQEELGKIPMLYRIAAEIRVGTPIQPRKLQKRFRNHRHKTWANSITDFVAAPSSGNQEDDVRRLMAGIASTDVLLAVKESALYVDFTPVGFVAPADAFTSDTEAPVSTFIDLVATHITFYEETLPAATEGFAGEATEDERRLLTMLAELSPDDLITLLAAMRDAVRRGLADQAASRDPE